MAGELTCDVLQASNRNAFTSRVTYDATTWANGGTGWYFKIAYGPSAAGPWTPAQTYSFNTCDPLVGGDVLQLQSLAATIVQLSDPTIGTVFEAGSTWFVRWQLFDNNDVQQDEIACGPVTTDAYPTLFACAGFQTGTTTATLVLGGIDGTVNGFAPCNQDTVVWEYGTTPGGPYPNTITSQAAAASPSVNISGLTPGTTYYYRAQLSENVQTGGVYVTSPDCSVTTNDIPLIEGVTNQVGPYGTQLCDDFTVTDGQTIVSVTSAPAGATITGTGPYQICYTPPTVGDITFTISAEDSRGAIGTAQITFTGTNTAPVIDGLANAMNGLVGTELCDDFTVTDVEGSATIVSVTSNVPAAVITGTAPNFRICYTPTTPGGTVVTVTATDDQGASSTDTITFAGYQPAIYTRTGTCTPYVTPQEVLDCCKTAQDLGLTVTSPILLDAIEDASMVVYYLTGRQFSGTCPIKLRPCFECPCDCGCDCTGCEPHQVDLGVWPVTAITSIWADGEMQPVSDYHIDYWHYLVRNDGERFPFRNNMPSTPGDAKDVAPWTVYEVEVEYGLPIPRLLSRAARELACELLQDCAGEVCALPDRVTSVSRRGISMDITSAEDFLTNGRTGIYAVDLAIQTFNPSKLQSPSFVWSPDTSRNLLRETHTI